jgi:hypothetical protein
MTYCSSCKKELKDGEEFGLVRIQLWKTNVGSKECKQPDMDDTRTYCLPCTDHVRTRVLKV